MGTFLKTIPCAAAVAVAWRVPCRAAAPDPPRRLGPGLLGSPPMPPAVAAAATSSGSRQKRGCAVHDEGPGASTIRERQRAIAGAVVVPAAVGGAAPERFLHLFAQPHTFFPLATSASAVPGYRQSSAQPR